MSGNTRRPVAVDARRCGCVLLASGLDPSGGAGLLMDAAIVRGVGAGTAGVATCLTVQSPSGVKCVRPVPTELIDEQVAAITRELPIRAIKVGLFGSPRTARVLARVATRLGAPLVVDPIIRSSSGFRFLSPPLRAALMRDLVPAATLLTPNALEAEDLSGRPVRERRSAVEAARLLVEAGAAAVLVKGIREGRSMLDILVDAAGAREFAARRVPDSDPRGTGCALSSAIAAHLALGASLVESIERAKKLVRAAILRRYRPSSSGIEFLGISRRPARLGTGT